MSDEALNLATNLALKMLMENREFLNSLEEAVEKHLDELQPGPSTGNSAIRDLTSALRTACSMFSLENESIKESDHSSRDLGSLFEAGLKVEQAADERGIEIACRRVCHVIRRFIIRISHEVHVRNCYTMSSKIAELCYTIAAKCGGDNSRLLDATDEFNAKVVGELQNLLRDRQRPKSAGNSVLRSSARDAMVLKRRTHAPGSIATSIVTRNKGYLMNDGLYKARHKLAKKSKKTKQQHANEENEDVKKTAKAISQEIIDELRASLKLKSDDHLVLLRE
ncbi:unnamed protein product [Caenorhabditis bovis]|uniref:Uncharacterized protein n=1 Tax=Caenorhabditis bovis TaxID=2654633 RepID=A0A8S1EHL7_9PELO|nr:unnamed protein product [Caenorhabditis bovis]